MAETVGLLILSAAGATTSVTGIGTASAFVFADVAISVSTVATVVGATAITAAAIGLQYALSNPNTPKPENGAQPLKQSVPVRQRGYGVNRLAGSYLLFLAAGNNSQDVLAFHSGRIEEVLQLYLHDHACDTTGTLAHGEYCVVVPPFDIAFQFVNLQVFYGLDNQNVCDISVNASTTSGVWTSAHAAKGIACIAMECGAASDPEQFTKVYPQGLPLPSVVARCTPVWDPRDEAQSLDDRETWTASLNGVLQLIDYLTEPDGGMGEDREILFPPETLAQWMAEADLCDELVGGRPRYETHGFYQFDNSPENVIGRLLASFDGWLAEDGDGSLVLTVGYYREPTDPPLTAEFVKGYSWRKGVPDEEAVNQIDVSFTNPDKAYVTDQYESVRDEALISTSGVVRAKPLDLAWVQDGNQAKTLARRAMLRLNPEVSGTLVTTLYGMRYLGKRWIKLQLPIVRGLEDCVVEIQDQADVDLLAGTVTFSFIKVDPLLLQGLDTAAPPILNRESSAPFVREDNSYYVRETY